MAVLVAVGSSRSTAARWWFVGPFTGASRFHRRPTSDYHMASSGRAEQLFHLTSAHAILALIGQSEDAHFDCKEWPAKDEDAQKVFAKAACGLANAEGGVLVVGMKAKAISKDEPDLVDSAAPVADTGAEKSRILDLVGQLVEPGIEGIQAAEVNEPSGSKSGFVIVYVPASEGSPRRSRKDWKFYLRIGSGTIPMEYFQIADMFGKRPQPKLELYLEATGNIRGIPYDPTPHRFFWIGLSNTGRGLAKFPAVRLQAGGQQSQGSHIRARWKRKSRPSTATVRQRMGNLPGRSGRCDLSGDHSKNHTACTTRLKRRPTEGHGNIRFL